MNTELEQRIHNLATENHDQGLNCAESVLDALIRCGVVDLPPESLALCTGFGGGIGMTGNTCGALSAAILALGSKFGRRDPFGTELEIRKKELRTTGYRVFNSLVNAFIEQNGSAICREISSRHGAWQGQKRKEACTSISGYAAVLAYRYLSMSREEADSLQYGRNMGGCK